MHALINQKEITVLLFLHEFNGLIKYLLSLNTHTVLANKGGL